MTDHPCKGMTKNQIAAFEQPHMTASEVVQTALKAALTALEHEARELFTYRGQAVFNPHLDLNAVAMLAQVHRPAPEGGDHA